jgi:hypothetical protein
MIAVKMVAVVVLLFISLHRVASGVDLRVECESRLAERVQTPCLD